MKIRSFQASDKENCLAIFDSNCPKFFDSSEREMFLNWLNHLSDSNSQYSSPAYSNSEGDYYYVIEIPDKGVIACAGFYILKEEKEARLAWGMVHRDHHQKGYGTLLYQHRQTVIKQTWPNHKMTLGTSQHTFSFYKKMGMKVLQTLENGYGIGIDRYDMQE